jgi:RIO kinase 1
MKAPQSLETLLDYGIIQEVIRPLMSGKEAQVYVVLADGEECVAKVYKEATQRTFKHRSDYTEGRRTRNTRDQHAVSKRTQHGRKKDEDAWRTTEVDTIYRLRDAGVRVPEPINFVEGVLVMELVKDADGEAAPRLGDLSFSPSAATGSRDFKRPFPYHR